ncbi:MAG TPA: hypothetical protein ENK54_10290 [Thiotrichales bacterium]|nr:hypothetical protein [Thiotrichales bacterium]
MSTGRILAIIGMVVAIAVVVPFFLVDPLDEKRLEGLPWQVEVLPDGTSRVFAIHVGEDSLEEAARKLGPGMEVAIVSMLKEQGSLEAYWDGFSAAGVLTGKLILLLEPGEGRLEGMRRRVVTVDYTGTGAKKMRLHPDDVPAALAARVMAITFIPTVDFDEEVVRQRFGVPARRLRDATGAEHFLYPRIGLDLILHEKGKEVLQYVAPRDFERLTRPLEEAPPAVR